jgi:hypothetical protein
LEKIIQRLKISVPILTYAKTDQHLKALMITQLLKNCYESKEAVLVPEGLQVTRIPLEDFEAYRGVLGGVTPQNAAQVTSQLAEMRLGLPAVTSAPAPVPPITGKTRPNEGGEQQAGGKKARQAAILEGLVANFN